jgi:hypothetical protein
VAGVAWPEATGIRARGDQRRTRHRAGLATLTAVFGFLLAATAVIVAPIAGPPAPGTGHPSAGPTDTSALPAARIIRRGAFPHTHWPLASAVGNGSLFVAFVSDSLLDAGEMVRVDTQSLAVTARWPIPAWPSSVVVTTSYVWVAGSARQAPPALPAALNENQVDQFDLSGTLLHTYALDAPFGLAPDGDTVWAEYSDTTHSLLTHLHDGVADPPIQLSGVGDPMDSESGRPLVVCSDGVYVTSYRQVGGAPITMVDRIQGGQVVGHADSLTGYSSPVLSCAVTRGVLIMSSDRQAAPPLVGQHLFDGAPGVDPAATLPGSPAAAIRGGNTVVWLLGAHGYFAVDKDLTPISTGINPIAGDPIVVTGLAQPKAGFAESFTVGGDNLWMVSCTDNPVNVCSVFDLSPT